MVGLESRVGEYEQVVNLLVTRRYHPTHSTMWVTDDRPLEGMGWNSNHPIFTMVSVWRDPLLPKRPDILVLYTTYHGQAERPSLHGTLFKGRATQMRAGFVVRGTRELPWSCYDDLEALLASEKIY